MDASPVTAVNITKKHLELAWNWLGRQVSSSFHHFPESIFEVSARNESGMRRSRIPPTDWDSHGAIGDFNEKSGSGQFHNFHNSGRNLHNFLAVTIFQFSYIFIIQEVTTMSSKFPSGGFSPRTTSLTLQYLTALTGAETGAHQAIFDLRCFGCSVHDFTWAPAWHQPYQPRQLQSPTGRPSTFK